MHGRHFPQEVVHLFSWQQRFTGRDRAGAVGLFRYFSLNRPRVNLISFLGSRCERFLDNLLTEASIADTARIEQEEKIQEAVTRKTVQTALDLVKLGLKNTQISQATGLAEGEIDALRNSALQYK